MNQRPSYHMQRLTFVLRACLVLLAASLVSGTAFAQAITTSSLWGKVIDDNDAAVEGADVTVVHEPTGANYNVTSRPDGTFVVRGLRPGGPYTVTVSTSSGAKGTVGEVLLDLDRGAEVIVPVTTEPVVELAEMEISGRPMDRLFDPNQTGSGSFLGMRDIQNTPAGDRSINALARLDPRVSYNRDPQDRAISVNGLSNRYNSIQVDGVSVSDPFGLNANNTAAERNVIPLESLEALSIETAPYNARNAGFVGARINAATRSGTNEFKGSVAYSYRGRSAFGGYDLVGTELDGREYALGSFSEETYSLNLGGPIVPKKLFFFVSSEWVREDRVAPSPIRDVDPAIVSQITAAAEALGFEPGSPTPPTANKLEDDNILAKLDWQINADHRATLRYSNVESSRPTFPGFGSGVSENNFSYSSAWFQQEISNETMFAQLVSRWNPRLNTEISVSHAEYHSEPKNSTRQPYVQIRNVPVAGSSNTSYITFGTENSRHANVLDVETDTAEIFATYELSDNHTLQGGVQFESADVYNLFVQNAYGYYDFNNLAQFLAVAANNSGANNYRTYTYNEILDDVDAAATFNEKNTGLFINDQWRVTPTLKFDIGARLDRASLPDDVPYNATFFSTFNQRNDSSYDGEMIAQPRFGFNWQPAFDDKRTTIRGGFGLFYGRSPRVWISNSYSNTGMNYRTWSAGTNPAYGGSSAAPIVSSDPDAQATNVGTGAPAMQVAFMDPNFELPSRWKTNLAIERELGFLDLKGSAEIELSWVENDVFYNNINLASTRTMEDGRLLYFNNYAAATQASNGTWNGSSGTRLVSNAFTNRTMKLGNTDQGESRTVSFSLERPRKSDGWYWKASYVNTDAEEVLFGTSSVAASNWNNRSIFNPNEVEVSRSSLEIRDKVLINVTKDFEFFKGNRTTVSLLYEGRTGYPFSFVFTNDANGDSQTQNDLLYVPLRAGDPTVRFGRTVSGGVVTQTAEQAQEMFYRIVDRFGLREGRAVSANSHRYPWVNQFDLSIKQQVKLPGWRHRLELGLDILNVGNLLNDKWGIIRGSNQFFVKREGVVQATYDGVANQWVYSNVSTALANNSFNPALGRGEPAATRWTMLMTARYSF